MVKREDKVRVVGKRREGDVSGRVIREWRELRPLSASTGHQMELHPLSMASVSCFGKW